MRNNIDLKSIPKLSQSRGVTLPVIRLNEFNTSSSPRLIRSGLTRATFGPPSTFNEGHSPQHTSSPVGYTLRHSNEHSLSHDLNRTTVSESFNVGSNGEDEVQIRIFFPNGKAVQFAVESGQQAPSSALLDLMADHLEIDSTVACDAFALWLISPLLEVQLKPHHVAFEVHEKWPAFLRKFTTAQEEEVALDEPLLVLKRNFQLTIEHESEYVEEYERLSEVLYLDAKDQYMSGRYLVDVDLALELAALQLAVDFGPYESSEETLDLIQMSIPTKTKRAVITLDVNKKIINASAHNNSKELSKQFNLPASSIRNIVGNKAAILKVTDEGVEAKRQCLQSVKNKSLEEAVFQWFKGARSENIPISGPLLAASFLKGEGTSKTIGKAGPKRIGTKIRDENRSKLEKKAQELDSFKASDGWLGGFKHRYSITFKEIQGEAGEVDLVKLGNWQRDIFTFT